MNLRKYDFHDGCLIKVQQVSNKIEMVIESAEIADEELEDKITLSKNNTIIGKLHLENIESIKVNNNFVQVLNQNYDVGNIFAFDIEEKK